MALTINDVKNIAEEDFLACQKAGFPDARIQYIDASEKAFSIAQKQFLQELNSESPDQEKIDAAEKVFQELRKGLSKAYDPNISWDELQVENNIILEQNPDDIPFEELPLPTYEEPSETSPDSIIEELRMSNAKMADLMLEMKAEIDRLTEAKDHPIRNTFKVAAAGVANALKTCDNVIKEFKKEREELRMNVQKKFGSLRSNSPETQGIISSVRDVYNSCEADIMRAIESIEQMKGHLESEVAETAVQIKKVTVVDKAQSLLQSLADKANLIRANAADKKADKHRKHARNYGKVKNAILDFDKTVHKYSLRFKNAVHAIKGESLEQTPYERKGIMKKLIDTLEEDCRREQKEALKYQQKADAIKAFTPVQEDSQEDKEKQSSIGPIKM